MKNLKIGAAALGLAVISGAAQAALISRGGGMIYDTTRNLTWLADMNYAKTSGYHSDGLMKWAIAKQWADSLVYGGYDDWRLPTLNPSDTTCSYNFSAGNGFPLQHWGYNCMGGELSGLLVKDLGNKPGESVLNQTGDTAEQIANLALFSNVERYGYWSDTESLVDPTGVWSFLTYDGIQIYDVKDDTLRAVAVRSGDVAAVVPEPQTLALALLALGATLVARKRRPA